MEFNISCSALLKSLSDVSRAIPAKAASQMYDDFLLVVKDNTITITATDGELTLRTSIEVEDVKEEGSIAVMARQILDLLKMIPDQPICIRTSSDTTFECIWSNGNSTLPYLPGADYPEIAGAEIDARSIVFPAHTLVDGIASTVYATADDEMRPAMNGIFFDLTPEGCTLVASDAHKLICYSADAVKHSEKDSFILHKKPANVLRSILDKEEEDVSISFDSKNIVFNFGTTMMICRAIVGKYPKYREVIPQNNANILNVDRAMLLGAVRRVSVCANKASNHIKFELRESGLDITAQDLNFATAAYEHVACEYSGNDISIGFKSNFLIEILSNMACENLVMKLADARRAVLVIPSEEEQETDKICAIIMPVMVS